MSYCERPELRELVPWYVNGSLDPAEREELERHLRACGECAVEARRCEELGATLRASAPAAPSPHPAQLEALLQRLDRSEAEADDSPPRDRRPSRLGALRRATPGPVKWLVAAQFAALVLVLLTAAVGGAGTRPPAFRTLSDAPVPRAPAVRIVFAPESTEAEIRRVLLEVRAEIVAGPSPLGAYTLALGPASAGESTGAVLELLRAHSSVRFAEPVAGADEAGK